MSTPRPTLDVDTLTFSLELYNQRRKALRSKVRNSHAVTRHVNLYRTLQHAIFCKEFGYTKKAAKSAAEDPSPYEKGYIFYCVSDKEAVG
jgi:hypothetical protein